MTASDNYIKERQVDALCGMAKNLEHCEVYEFHKGQFLAFREILYPEKYGRNVKAVEKHE